MNRSALTTPLRSSTGAVASRLEPALLTVTAAALTAGGAAWLTGDEGLADLLWGLGTLLAVPPAVGWVVAALRRGQAGVDLIAVLALGGTLAVHEYLAGVLIALMLATGRTLEAAARRRASHDLSALLEHAPRSARRRTATGVSTVPLSEVATGDLLVVGPGEVVPVDGRVEGAVAKLDESVLTGESLSVERPTGDAVRSGVVNVGGAFELRATATEQDSTYAGVVRLARQAGAGSAPVVRLADRYAAWFLPLTLAAAGTAWLLSGSAVRAVAVLVVATPCPLLLAAPVAIVSGLSRASRLGVVMRDGGALENLGRARTLLLDKTGTLTRGRPRVVDVLAAPGWQSTEVLRLAASLDQYSPHVLAEAIVDSAHERKLVLSVPSDVTEEPGRGASGIVDGHRLSVGRFDVPGARPPWARAVDSRAILDGAAVAWLAVDGWPVGAVLLRDPLRHDAARFARRVAAGAAGSDASRGQEHYSREGDGHPGGAGWVALLKGESAAEGGSRDAGVEGGDVQAAGGLLCPRAMCGGEADGVSLHCRGDQEGEHAPCGDVDGDSDRVILRQQQRCQGYRQSGQGHADDGYGSEAVCQASADQIPGHGGGAEQHQNPGDRSRCVSSVLGEQGFEVGEDGEGRTEAERSHAVGQRKRPVSQKGELLATATRWIRAPSMPTSPAPQSQSGKATGRAPPSASPDPPHDCPRSVCTRSPPSFATPSTMLIAREMEFGGSPHSLTR